MGLWNLYSGRMTEDQWKVDSGRMEQKKKSWAFLQCEGLENCAVNARWFLAFLIVSTGVGSSPHGGYWAWAVEEFGPRSRVKDFL